jgi:hypothetical protein
MVQWSDGFARYTTIKAPERFLRRFDLAQMSLDAATQGLGVALESAVNKCLDSRRESPEPLFLSDRELELDKFVEKQQCIEGLSMGGR